MIGEIDSTYWKPIQENLNNIRWRRKSEEPKPEDVEPPSQRFAATMNGKKMPTRDAVEKKKKLKNQMKKCVESDRQKPKLKHDADKKQRRPQGKHPHKAK